MTKKTAKFDTNCVHGVYKAENAQPQVIPIIQNTTFRYYDSSDIAALFNLDSPEFFYSRLANPTVSALEGKMALLEDGSLRGRRRS